MTNEPVLPALPSDVVVVVDEAVDAHTDEGVRYRVAAGRYRIVGIPDVAIRATSDMIMAMSNMPLTRPLGLPIPDPRDKDQVAVSRSVMTPMGAGELRMYGALLHPGLVMRLPRVMSVNG